MATRKKTTKTEPNASEAPPPAPAAAPKSYLPTTQTGLQDYSYWWAYCRENAKTVKPNVKEFRRGRVWT